MEKTTWKHIDPTLHTELVALLKDQSPTSAFYTQYEEVWGFWMLAMLACIGGLGTAVWYFATEPGSFSEILPRLLRDPFGIHWPVYLGSIAAIVIGVWTALTWMRNHKRRGLALTKDAIVVVRGNKLKILKYRDVASHESSQHGRRGNRFTALTLKTRDGETLTLLTNGNWARAAAAKLP